MGLLCIASYALVFLNVGHSLHLGEENVQLSNSSGGVATSQQCCGRKDANEDNAKFVSFKLKDECATSSFMAETFKTAHKWPVDLQCCSGGETTSQASSPCNEIGENCDKYNGATPFRDGCQCPAGSACVQTQPPPSYTSPMHSMLDDNCGIGLITSWFGSTCAIDVTCEQYGGTPWYEHGRPSGWCACNRETPLRMLPPNKKGDPRLTGYSEMMTQLFAPIKKREAGDMTLPRAGIFDDEDGDEDPYERFKREKEFAPVDRFRLSHAHLFGVSCSKEPPRCEQLGLKTIEHQNARNPGCLCPKSRCHLPAGGTCTKMDLGFLVPLRHLLNFVCG